MFSTKSNLNDFNTVNMSLKLYLQNYKTPTCKLGFRNRSFDICAVIRCGFRSPVSDEHGTNVRSSAYSPLGRTVQKGRTVRFQVYFSLQCTTYRL